MKSKTEKDLYGEFTNQNPPAKLQIYVEDDYLCIKVVKAIDFENEMIIIKMDKEEYKHFFGKIAQFDTYYKGRLLPVKDGEKSLCIFDETDSEIKIKSLLQNPYITETGFDPTDTSLLGVIFKSTEKIMRTTRDEKRSTKVLDIECSFIETTRLGSIEGGTKVLDIVNGDSHENTNLKYIKLESNVINSIFVNVVNSITKDLLLLMEDFMLLLTLDPDCFNYYCLRRNFEKEHLCAVSMGFYKYKFRNKLNNVGEII